MIYMSKKEFYTVEEVSERLQVHWQSVLNAIKRGELEAVKLGRGYRITEQAILDFIVLRTKGTKK